MKTKFADANNEKLLSLYREMKTGSLILRPSFQRKLVWNNKHKENFIDTILNGYPFPEVYFCEGEIDMESQVSTRLVVDGQQRMNTIYDYIEGNLLCKKVPKFEDLPIESQKDFYGYKIVVRDLGKITEEEVREIFKRINSVQYALNAMEIRNALYEGEYISTAKKLASDVLLKKMDVFTETQSSRMKNTEFMLTVMTTIELGAYFTRDEEVGEFIKDFDDKYPSKHKTVKEILGALRLIEKLKLPSDSTWFRLSSFFTLVVELLIFKTINGAFPGVQKLKKVLDEFQKNIEKSKSDDRSKNQYAEYYYYIYQATASKTARIRRGEILRKHLLKVDNI